MSIVRPRTSSVRISSRKPVGSSLPASSVGKRLVRFAAEGLDHEPAKRGMNVGKARDERLGVAGPVEVDFSSTRGQRAGT